MNTLKRKIIACAIALTGFAPTVVFADTVVISDIGANAYWGGMVTSSDANWLPSPGALYPSNTDTLPGYHGADYNVDQMTVTRTADTFTAVLEGGYFQDTKDRFVGDLFLSTSGWYPSGDAPNYATDNLTNGTQWNYVLHIDQEVTPNGNPQGGVGATITLYALDPSGKIITPEQLSYDSGSGPTIQGDETYRDNQAVSYNPAVGQEALATGHWELDPNAIDSVTGDPTGSFIFILDELTQYSLDNGYTFESLGLLNDNLGLHWTMSCANDVIEGSMSGAPSVPEPATMVLFGLGLSGLAGYRLRRKK